MNAGLINVIQLLETIKEQHPRVSYADLYQMASAQAIEFEYTGGGPNLEIRYGRQDARKNLPTVPPHLSTPVDRRGQRFFYF